MIIAWALATALQSGPIVLAENEPMRLNLGTLGRGEVGLGSATVTVSGRGEHAYSVEVKSPFFRGEVKRNDLVYVTFEARAPQTRHESGLGLFNTALQRGSDPFDGFAYSSGSVGKDWRTFHFVGRADKDYPAGSVEFALHVALASQTLEIRKFRALNYGPNVAESTLPKNEFTWAGRAADAPWRKKAEAMIRQHRQAPLTVVVRERGRPVRNRRVRVEMVRHAYPFGTFMEYHQPKAATDPDSQRFVNYLTQRRFSRLTAPIYWADWGWESETTRADYLSQLDWAFRSGHRVKAHVLLWPSARWMPSRLQGLADGPYRNAIFSAMDDRLAALKRFPFENLDVLNELKTEQDVEKRLGMGALVDTFRRARTTFPKADLVYNDFAVFEGTQGGGRNFEIASNLTQRLKKGGAPITLSGWQGHFGEDVTPPERVWTLIDRWKRETGLPLEITEYDLNTRDEQAQADYLRDLLTAWFAHPDTRGFTLWGFWEGSHWLPNGAMIRRDWSRKPMAVTWDELVTRRWWTDATSSTNARGEVQVRGFHGDYVVTVGGVQRRATLSPGGARLVIDLPSATRRPAP